MKTLSLISLLLVSAQLAAQTVVTPTAATSNADGSISSSGENARNGVLLDNAAKSQEYLKQSGFKQSTNKFLKGSNAEAQAAAKENLTDQEKQLVDTYVDLAGGNKIIKEKCVGEMKEACAGEEVDHKVMGMSPMMIKMATQAYALFGSMGDFMPVSKGSGENFKMGTADSAAKDAQKAADEASKTGGEAAQKAKDKAGEAAENAKDKKATDYCKYIPMATETFAKIYQSDVVKKLDAETNNGGETSQKEMLLKAAKSHDSRAKQAQVQAVGWYGSAACYAVKAATGSFAVDTALVVKLGAATLLGTFYQSEVSTNKGYGDKVREIANSLPGVGQCNPITENNCYCAEEEHKNDTRYCGEQIQARLAAATNFQRVTCIDNKMQADRNCTCDKTNTCFDKIFEQPGYADLKLGVGYTNSPFRSIAALAHGRLENAVINGSAATQSAAIAKKALAELAAKVPSGNNPLTLAQKEMYDGLIGKGIPSNAARLMAMNPPPASAMADAKTKVASLGAPAAIDISSYTGRGSNVVDFSGGNGLGLGGRKAEKKSGVDEFLGKLNPNQKNAATAGKILEFAQKAERQAAQVSKADKPIFEIISLRYQLSGRRLLQVDPPAQTTAAGN